MSMRNEFTHLQSRTNSVFVWGCRTVCQKINTAEKSVEKQGKLTPQLKCAFAAAQTKAEVEHLVRLLSLTSAKFRK